MGNRFDPLSAGMGYGALNTVSALSVLACLLTVAPHSQAQGLASVPSRVLATPADGTDCAGGLIYDDGTFEDAFGGSPGAQNTKIVELVSPTVTPATLSHVCVAFTRTQDLPNNASMDFTIEFFAVDGPMGAVYPFPGTVLARIPAHVDGIPLYPITQFYAIDTSQAPVISDGSVYVGASWDADPNGPSPFVYFSVDTSTPTTVMPVFTVGDVGSGAWLAMTDLTGNSSNYLRAMGIRALQESASSVPPLRPAATPMFSPQVVLHGTPSTLTITLANRNPNAATLSADFIDNLPAGIVVSTPSNPATNCTNGIVAANAGEAGFSLSAGAVIPAAATCTMTVSVVAAAGGTYTDSIASDALQTDLGNNTALPAEAALIVSTGGGSGGSIDENFDETNAPDLPLGWTSPVVLGTSIWTTSNGDGDTLPNAAHAPDAPRHSDFSLTSPSFAVTAGAVLSFRNKYEFENDVNSPPTCYDGGVLEISTDGGATFGDIVESGGIFQTGGYTCAIDGDSSGNPLGGRQAWGGTTGTAALGGTLEWIDVKVDLAAFAGRNAILRWRECSDTSNSFYASTSVWPGWWIDSVEVSGGGTDAIFKDGFEVVTAAPTLAKAFALSSVETNIPTTLTITLANPNATVATLTSDLVDAFPTGLVSAANASTTCTGGSGVLQTGRSVGLAAGAAIPAAGSCTITVDVAAQFAGDFTNTIPAGGLATDAGSNADEATATLTATSP